MAKVKVVNGGLDQNLNGTYFNNVPSETLFSFGKFSITSNFDGRKYIDYNNTLSSFVRSVTLETMGVSEVQSNIIVNSATNAVLNLDKSDLNTFIRFGSAYEFLRVSVESIINTYPAGLHMSPAISINGNLTYFDYIYDVASNITSFKIPINCIENPFSIAYNFGNTNKPNNMEIRNLNLAYNDYIIWTSINPTGNEFTVVEYSGNTSGRKYLELRVKGNPFYMVSGTSAQLDFHLKPNNVIFEEYRTLLSQYEKYMISSRDGMNGFIMTLKEPTLTDDGNISYDDSKLMWSTSDGYNIDISTSTYSRFLESILTIGAKYDKVKTDLIARFLTPASLKTYDLTEDGKVTKLLRIYGKEFDQLREFIDSLVYINHVTYDKVNNIPDQLIKNLSRTFGWDYFSLVNESELVESFLNIDSTERDLNKDLLPSEIDIELWRRILINSNYFWKTKGTREAIKSMFLLIGIPEPFINITEYVYTVEGKINPNTVPFSMSDFPTNSFPYDSEGYPVAPLETKDFYFQASGNTDSGQAYMNVFRKAGFNLIRNVDNKKSWEQSGAVYRVDDTTPQYYLEDSRLVLNTKEVDISLDTARGIEYDVYEYIKKDYSVNSSGYTLPYSYVNISLGYNGNQSIFPLPSNYTSNKVLGSLEVRFNGILLNGANIDNSYDTLVNTDYVVDSVSKTFTLLNNMHATNNVSRRDVIQATFIYSGGTHSLSGITVQYILTRVSANVSGTLISLPSMPRGDVQVTINGIALTKGTPQFVGDYVVDLAGQQLVIQNIDLIAYLAEQPEVQIAYIDVTGSNDIYSRSEILRVDSLSSNKLYYNNSANKYVYKLNYKSNKTSDIKILIDGIALEPELDYSINSQNLYEVFLLNGIKYGNVISVYYLVGGNSVFNPVINDLFGLGDISSLSFLEFIELIQRKMINAKNRKTITDFNGGWYPSLLKLYMEYLKRSKLAPTDPLLSNGYTFKNLYSFLSKYNAFFKRFVDELISPTIILRKSGLLVRNSIFTKQKFSYRRGVNLESVRGANMYKYLGDDGAVYKIGQLPPPQLYVETVPAVVSGSTLITGGENVSEYDILTSYGVQYRCYDASTSTWNPWDSVSALGSLNIDNYVSNINGFSSNTCYEYKSFIKSGIYGYTGNTLGLMTPTAISLKTCAGSTGISSIKTGGFDLVGYGNADYYGIEYRCLGNVGTSSICINPTTLNYSSGASSKNITISGDSWNTYSVIKDPALNWITPSQPIVLSPNGVSTSISVTSNNAQKMTQSRTGVLCYVPSSGSINYVTINQDGTSVPITPVYMECRSGGSKVPLEELACSGIDTTTDMTSGQCYALNLGWSATNPSAGTPLKHCIDVACNGVSIYNCVFSSKVPKNCNGTIPSFIVRHSDNIGITVYADAKTTNNISSTSSVYISSIVNSTDCFGVGDSSTYMTKICAETDGIN